MSETLGRCPKKDCYGTILLHRKEDLLADPKNEGKVFGFYPCGECSREKVIDYSILAWSDGYD